MKDIIKKYNLGFVVDDSDINDQLNAVENVEAQITYLLNKIDPKK